MFFIDIDQAAATELIALIASHLPIGTSLGRIMAASPDGLITSEATWCYHPAQDCVSRIVETRHGAVERTRWRCGREEGRAIVDMG